MFESDSKCTKNILMSKILKVRLQSELSSYHGLTDRYIHYCFYKFK